jgi:octaprenyl-diphosphate synthase
MDFKDIQKSLEPELVIVGNEIRKSLDSPIGFIGQVASYLIESGGKRFRPVLLLSSHAFGYFGERIYAIASTLEFIHTATLLHDDVVDVAHLRRGQPSANVLWGNEATVLVGDFLLARSFLKLVHDKDFEVLDCVSMATTKMAEGEILQLLKTKEPKTTEEEYLEVVRCKTAILISAAAEIGAIIGESKKEERQKMRDFGMLLGIAFQITDDTLDYITEDKTLGKTQGQDFIDGKVTLPFIYAYSKSTPEQQRFLEEMLVKDDKTPEDFSKVYKVIENKGAFKYCFDKARDYIDEAKQLISFIDNDYRKCLEAIADYTIERSF